MAKLIEFHKKSNPARACACFNEACKLEEGQQNARAAMKAYRQAVDLDPKQANACNNIGTIYYKREDFVQAGEWFCKAIEIDPNHALAWFNFGNTLEELGQRDEAIDAYKKTLELNPSYADAHYNLAFTLEKQKEHSKALKHWQIFLKLAADSPSAIDTRERIKKIIKTSGLKLVARRSSQSSTLAFSPGKVAPANARMRLTTNGSNFGLLPGA